MLLGANVGKKHGKVGAQEQLLYQSMVMRWSTIELMRPIIVGSLSVLALSYFQGRHVGYYCNRTRSLSTFKQHYPTFVNSRYP